MKKFIILIALLLPFTIFAQVDDNFNDGNINDWTESTTDRWAASTDNPINGTHSLHHVFDNSIADHDQISIPFGSFDISSETTTWRFQVRYEYNPSADNTWGFFLFADTDALEMFPASTVVSGYVIGVNYTNSDDFIKLWEVSGGSESIVINTNYDWQVNITTSGTAGFEIKRTSSGDWSVFLDDDGGFDNLVQIGTTENNSDQITTSHIGICYEYTMSADQKLWIDDVYMGSEIADIDPPVIINVDATSNNTLIVNFNENLDQTTAENVSNYVVDGSIGNPNTATLNGTDNKQVELVFSSTFVDDNTYLLTVNGVEDLSNNACVNETAPFSYTQIAVTGATPISSGELDVFFNKTVDVTTAETLINYSVNTGIGNPATATVDGSDDKLVHLAFTNNFALEELYMLTVSNVEDNYGNVITTTDIDFTFYEAQAYDVVINEIMCDVNPAPEALPVHEYIELYNNSDYDVNFTGWTMQIGDNTERDFPAVSLPPGEYAIICEDDAESEFQPFGITIPFLTPSELTVSGKRILIKSSTSDVIEDITYSDDWYDDDDKDGGGWSIERIDPMNFCGEDENWTATMDYTGGTPGRINSVYAVNPDYSSPEVTELEYISSKQIRVHFSEKVDLISAENAGNYLLNGTVNPTTASASPEDGAIINLNFADNFNIGNNTIQIQNIEDNCSNVMDIYNGNFEYQLIYPVIIEVMSENQLRVHFSEIVDQTSAEIPSNYSVDGAIGNPDIAIISNTDSTIVNLQFSNSFTLEQTYTLGISNVEDINQNVMSSVDIEFVYYIPRPFDIVFNEIMADINPAPLGLPEERYIEIYNTSNFDIDLTSWIFISEGQAERELPFIRIQSGEYIILCEQANETLFSQYGDVLAILTSSDIIASGRNLKLKMPDETIIAEVTYSDEWYDDEEKDNGGWSLEIIDPTNFCGENDNWTASNDVSGGTPGQINSVDAPNQDNTAPELIDVHIVASNYLLLEFDENISYASGNDTLNFSVNNGINNPHLAYTDPDEKTKVHIQFSNHFSDGQDYTLMVSGVKDNCGNEIQTTGEDFTYHTIYPVELWVKDENRLKIQFSETVDFETGTNVLNYTCDNSAGNPEFAVRETADTTVIHLQFAEAFPNGEEITLSIENIEDINGNVMDKAEMTFTYYTPKAGDIVINEVLFDAYPDGSDFIELYNRTQYEIDLVNIQIATRDDENLDSITSISPLSETNFNFAPETYMAFTTDKEGVLRFYMSENEETLIEIGSIPTYPNDLGTVLVLYKNDSIIDEFDYNADMHFKLLDDEEGVSLERVNYGKETQDASNWHSASEVVGFATPAYKNSQFVEAGDPSNDPVNIEPYQFSPDNDGIDDYANINYNFQNPGYVATVYIFDAKGRIVKQLANNLLLPTEGTLVWDGLYTDNRIAHAGTYLVYFKVFDLDGTVKLYKKAVVLAKRI